MFNKKSAFAQKYFPKPKRSLKLRPLFRRFNGIYRDIPQKPPASEKNPLLSRTFSEFDFSGKYFIVSGLCRFAAVHFAAESIIKNGFTKKRGVFFGLWEAKVPFAANSLKTASLPAFF